MKKDWVEKAWKESETLESIKNQKAIDDAKSVLAQLVIDAEYRHTTANVLDFSVGSQLKLFRLALGKSFRDFAPTLGITAQYLSDIEKGRRKLSPNIIKRIKVISGAKERGIPVAASADLSTPL